MSDLQTNPYSPPALPPENLALAGGAVADARLRDTRTLGWVVVGLVLGCALVRSINDVVASLVNTRHIEATQALLDFLGLFRFLPTVLFFVAAVFHSIWIFRTAKNATLIQGLPLSLPPPMAVGSYFIPIYCIFGPCMSMRELVRVSFRDKPGANLISLVVPWWLCFVFSRTLSSAFPDELAQLTVFFYFKFLLLDAAAVLLSLIIVRTSQAQAEAVIQDFTPQLRGLPPQVRYADPSDISGR